MRYIHSIYTILLLLLLLANGGVEVLAMNTGFSTELMLENDINTFLKNVNISLLENEPQKEAIECFAVNENGTVAIGCSDSENKTVCIYTSDGDFRYGYSFECSGNFGIELDKNVLIIYFVRSDVAVSVNPMGEVASIVKILNTYENNSYWNNCVFSTRRKVGDIEYILRNNMGFFNVFTSSYSQLITINANGEESIIYDVNSTRFSNMTTAFVVILMFICIAIAVVVWKFVNLNRST